MARLHHVKKAAKDYPEHGIKKGDAYYWWKFMVGGRGGPKRFSKTPPKRSLLTQSEFLGALYDVEDDISALVADDGLEACVSDIASRLNELADEQEAKKENLPDSLQSGSSGDQLQERADACRSAAEELEGIDYDVEGRDEGETEDDYWQSKLEEIQAVSIDAS